MHLDPVRRRPVVLGVILAGLVPAFALTHTVVSRYKRQRQSLADEWSARGSNDITRHPAAVVADFQTALSFDPENTRNRFRLAEALIRSSRLAEARSQLLTLWSEQPGKGEVNLELARLAATDHEVDDAVRYYHAAIDGAWESGATSARRQARLELARLLMQDGQNTRAQAELIATLDDLPPDATLITNVGSLLVDAGADGSARKVFLRALSVDRNDARAARLLGALEYRSENYQLARQYLQRASRTEQLEPQEQQILEVSEKVLSHDPGARRLTTRERAMRALADLEIARARLDRCRSASAIDAATATRVSEVTARTEGTKHLRTRDLMRDPDVIDQTMDLVFDIETLPSSCGEPTSDDRALQLLGAQRGSQSR